jgi:hypothetical protein
MPSRDASLTPRRWGLVALILLVVIVLSACSQVPFYEKGLVQDPIMTLAEDPTEVHAYQKIYYSREGSVGGIGTGAGGGCGCY